MGMGQQERSEIKHKISVLQLEHRDLDASILALQEQAYIDQLQMQRMKKRKLYLRDVIARLESMLIPDMPA